MTPLQPEQAGFLLHHVYLADLKTEHRITKSVIEAIPPDQTDYRPDEVSKSAMDLAWHIAGTEIRFMDAVISGAFDMTPRPRPESIRTGHDLAQWYEQNFLDRFRKLTTLSNDELIKVLDFRGVYQMEGVRFLGSMLRHSIHHRGQLAAYLRPMGASVPAIYGESYDSAKARKAAGQA